MFSVLKTKLNIRPRNIRLSLSHCVKSVCIRSFSGLYSGRMWENTDSEYGHFPRSDNKDIAILSGDKDSSIVIMNKKDYNRKIEDMTNEGIQQGKYKKKTDHGM